MTSFAYSRRESALALREIGRIERTLFTLAWLEDPDLRRRVNAGLNKGEAANWLARAVFFKRLGEISFENQQHRASGLNLVVASITSWHDWALLPGLLHKGPFVRHLSSHSESGFKEPDDENAAFFKNKDAAQIVVSAEDEISQNVKSTRWLGKAVD